ncbi:hypothetical protein BCR37DRAFT_380048 [Protomyces lactucae-debilis]|uniref:Uncharacterized protein n=1 Tax=Protomyces lactucae-debilis TaxID=2754530 RepID=A0A1Y2FDX8_PROLT|nr:uncharacterized protein BCR37DRAFT_380048 [Protomyces lactucae-debilis]ORY82112.1 hypothetical protein BCR37DRAFT_380048 [Protomyces lactucae-debilis]
MLRVSRDSVHCLTGQGTRAAIHRVDALDAPPVQQWQTQAGIQCLDWSHASTNLLALGYSTGAVDLIKPFADLEEAIKVPAARQRNCTAVAFGSGAHLAIGLDKVRHDYSLSLYNVETQTVTGQYAGSEGVSSLAWAPDSQHYLLAGLNYRWLRLIDLRQDPKDGSAISIPTKAAFNITVDVQDPNKFASTYGDTVSIWDRRASTGKPELCLCTDDKQRITGLRFAPSYRAHLAASCEDGSLNLWELDDAGDISRLSRANVARRQEEGLRVNRHHVVKRENLAGFDYCERAGQSPWTFLTLHGDGGVKADTVQTIKPAMSLSSRGDLSMAFGGKLRIAQAQETPAAELHKDDSSCSSPRLGNPFSRSESVSDSATDAEVPAKYRDMSSVLQSDISNLMRRRALDKYEMDAELNAGLVQEESLQTVWRWIAWSRRQSLAGKLRHGSLDFCYEGALNICSGSAGSLKRPNALSQAHTEKFTQAVTQVNSRRACDILPKSLSSLGTRQLALTTTGWCLTNEEFDVFQKDLLDKRQFDKAAFYAVAQHGQVEEAVKILMMGGSVMRIMSAAIAGFVAAKAGKDEGQQPFNIWKESCKRLAVELDSPYIRALFAFVSEGSWRDVLDEQGLTLRERISIAIRYLKDEEIASVLRAMSKTETDEGNLEGLLLTGITTTSLDLLQTYVDRTGDVQTVALVTSFKPELYEDPRVMDWVAEYKNLLNSWGLFHTRCRLDVMRNRLSREAGVTTRLPPRQIYVRCNHCGANLTHHRSDAAIASRDHTTHSGHQQSGMTATKATLCPSCRKPLPRCALCLLPLGTSPDQDTATCRVQDKAQRTFDWSLNFCLRCNHGCHSEHAVAWFRQSAVCPVSGCSCECDG